MRKSKILDGILVMIVITDIWLFAGSWELPKVSWLIMVILNATSTVYLLKAYHEFPITGFFLDGDFQQGTTFYPPHTQRNLIRGAQVICDAAIQEDWQNNCYEKALLRLRPWNDLAGLYDSSLPGGLVTLFGPLVQLAYGPNLWAGITAAFFVSVDIYFFLAASKALLVIKDHKKGLKKIVIPVYSDHKEMIGYTLIFGALIIISDVLLNFCELPPNTDWGEVSYIAIGASAAICIMAVYLYDILEKIHKCFSTLEGIT